MNILILSMQGNDFNSDKNKGLSLKMIDKFMEINKAAPYKIILPFDDKSIDLVNFKLKCNVTKESYIAAVEDYINNYLDTRVKLEGAYFSNKFFDAVSSLVNKYKKKHNVYLGITGSRPMQNDYLLLSVFDDKIKYFEKEMVNSRDSTLEDNLYKKASRRTEVIDYFWEYEYLKACESNNKALKAELESDFIKKLEVQDKETKLLAKPEDIFNSSLLNYEKINAGHIRLDTNRENNVYVINKNEEAKKAITSFNYEYAYSLLFNEDEKEKYKELAILSDISARYDLIDYDTEDENIKLEFGVSKKLGIKQQKYIQVFADLKKFFEPAYEIIKHYKLVDFKRQIDKNRFIKNLTNNTNDESLLKLNSLRENLITLIDLIYGIDGYNLVMYKINLLKSRSLSNSKLDSIFDSLKKYKESRLYNKEEYQGELEIICENNIMATNENLNYIKCIDSFIDDYILNEISTDNVKSIATQMRDGLGYIYDIIQIRNKLEHEYLPLEMRAILKKVTVINGNEYKKYGNENSFSKYLSSTISRFFIFLPDIDIINNSILKELNVKMEEPSTEAKKTNRECIISLFGDSDPYFNGIGTGATSLLRDKLNNKANVVDLYYILTSPMVKIIDKEKIKYLNKLKSDLNIYYISLWDLANSDRVKLFLDVDELPTYNDTMYYDTDNATRPFLKLLDYIYNIGYSEIAMSLNSSLPSLTSSLTTLSYIYNNVKIYEFGDGNVYYKNIIEKNSFFLCRDTKNLKLDQVISPVKLVNTSFAYQYVNVNLLVKDAIKNNDYKRLSYISDKIKDVLPEDTYNAIRSLSYWSNELVNKQGYRLLEENISTLQKLLLNSIVLGRLYLDIGNPIYFIKRSQSIITKLVELLLFNDRCILKDKLKHENNNIYYCKPETGIRNLSEKKANFYLINDSIIGFNLRNFNFANGKLNVFTSILMFGMLYYGYEGENIIR